MNKLIILLFSILIISCEPSKVPINTQWYPIDTSYVFNSSSDFIMFDGVVTKSDNKWKRNSTYKKVLLENYLYIEYYVDEGLVHDPNCPVCRREKEELLRKIVREELDKSLKGLIKDGSDK